MKKNSIIVWCAQTIAMIMIFASVASAQTWSGGYIDRAVSVPTHLSPSSILVEGWVHDDAGPTFAWVFVTNAKTGDQGTYWAFPVNIRPDVNKAYKFPADYKTGWELKVPCAPGEAYWISALNVTGMKYVACQSTDPPVIKGRVVNGKGEPLGLNTKENMAISARLIYMDDWFSYQPFELQNYQTGNGVVVDGEFKSYIKMAEGNYTLLVEGYGRTAASKTFYYSGGPIEVGTLVLHEDLVDIDYVAEYNPGTGKVFYSPTVNNRSGKEIELYTIVRSPGNVSEIVYEANRMVLGPGEHKPEHKPIEVPSWSPNGLYVVLEVVAIEKGYQHTRLGYFGVGVYIRR